MNLCAILATLGLFIVTHAAYASNLSSFFSQGKGGHEKGSYGAVTCGNEVCSHVGIEILKCGGNAADAAVAIQFCLGVISLDLTGLGGGGFALIRASNGSYTFVDFRETAPAAASENMYKDHEELSLSGGLASGVPGELRGLQYIYDHHCSFPWKRLIQPSIDLARNGFRFYEDLVGQIEYLDNSTFFVDDPQWAIDFAPNGTLVPPNSTITRKRYANLLETIANEGPDAFYTGRIANATVKAVQSAGGILTLDDLRTYKVTIRPTLEIKYRDYRLTSTGAPTSGPVTLSTFKVIESYDDFGDKSMINLSTHRLDEAIRFGYGERTKLGDPSFVPGIDAYQRAMPVSAYNPEGIENLPAPGTSHLGTADVHGLVIALTSTINTAFGSRVMVPETGLIMNNEMNDFSIPGESNIFGYIPSPDNYIVPGKKPQSSISPVIVEHIKSGALYFVVGAAGGSKIITSIIQTLWHVLDGGMDTKTAVAAPRLHDQLDPNTVEFEWTYDNGTAAFMADRGHNITWIDWRASNVNALRLLPNGTFEAATDPWLINGGSFVCC